MKSSVIASMVTVALLAGFTQAGTIDLRITETYTGVDGSDGTVDWFELTNLGAGTVSTGGLYYDDDSANPANNFALPVFDVAPGESIIVLIEADMTDIDVFRSFWGSPTDSVQVGITGGGSLGQGGDAVYVFDSNLPGANIVDSLAYPGSQAGLTGTIEDITGNGPLTNSVLGVNGAFLSVGVSGIGQLVGSPGLIPEPGVAFAIVGLSVIIARRGRMMR